MFVSSLRIQYKQYNKCLTGYVAYPHITSPLTGFQRCVNTCWEQIIDIKIRNSVNICVERRTTMSLLPLLSIPLFLPSPLSSPSSLRSLTGESPLFLETLRKTQPDKGNLRNTHTHANAHTYRHTLTWRFKGQVDQYFFLSLFMQMEYRREKTYKLLSRGFKCLLPINSLA